MTSGSPGSRCFSLVLALPCLSSPATRHPPRKRPSPLSIPWISKLYEIGEPISEDIQKCSMLSPISLIFLIAVFWIISALKLPDLRRISRGSLQEIIPYPFLSHLSCMAGPTLSHLLERVSEGLCPLLACFLQMNDRQRLKCKEGRDVGAGGNLQGQGDERSLEP